MNRIDVIIPTFMETVHLAEAIQSCKAQTFNVNHIFIVDDGSDEPTRMWIKNKYASDSQVTLIFSKHSGLPSIGRATGVELSNAEWIAFLDADDTWHPKKLEKQMDLALSAKVDFVYSNATQVVNGVKTEKLLTNLPTKLNFLKLVRTNWIVNSSVLMKRNLFTEDTPYATSYRVRAVEDYATWLRLSVFHNMMGLDEELTYYRVSENSLSKSEACDPQIYAYADFLLWSKKNRKKSFLFFRILALIKIALRYGR